LVVDTSPDNIVRRLHDLGLQNAAPFHHEDPIRGFTEDYELRLSATVAKSLLLLFEGLDIRHDDPVLARVAGWGNEPRLPISAIRSEDGATTFIATRWQTGDNAEDMARKVGEVREAIQQAADHSRRLFLAVPNETPRALLNIARRVFARNWLALEA
jgi:hypothetical protein